MDNIDVPSDEELAHVEKLKQDCVALKSMEPEPDNYNERARTY